MVYLEKTEGVWVVMPDKLGILEPWTLSRYYEYARMLNAGEGWPARDIKTPLYGGVTRCNKALSWWVMRRLIRYYYSEECKHRSEGNEHLAQFDHAMIDHITYSLESVGQPTE